MGAHCVARHSHPDKEARFKIANRFSVKTEGGAKLVDLNNRQNPHDRGLTSVKNWITLEELNFVKKMEPSRSTAHKIHGVKSWVCM